MKQERQLVHGEKRAQEQSKKVNGSEKSAEKLMWCHMNFHPDF